MRIVLAVVLALTAGGAIARDQGQFENSAPERRKWFTEQMMPDEEASGHPASCCGVADAYYADDYETKDGRFFAIITDDRDDAALKRAHVNVGTRVEIPQNKFNDTRLHGPNPTGHGIVFMRTGSNFMFVYCYFSPGGV